MIWNWLDDVAVGLIAGCLAAGAFEAVRRARLRRRLLPENRERRVLFPFVGRSISYASLDAAVRLASADHATLMPVYLARVPMRLGLDAAIPRQAATAVELLEAIEQRALRAGVPVDSRIVRGRTGQHALQRLTARESYYRMVLPAATQAHDGLSAQAIAWALDHAAGEIVVLRPGEASQPVFFGPDVGTGAIAERPGPHGRQRRGRGAPADPPASRDGRTGRLLRRVRAAADREGSPGRTRPLAR